MQCRDCGGKLLTVRQCRKIRMRCSRCGREYRIHEVADQLDAQTEAELEKYTCLIYD